MAGRLAGREMRGDRDEQGGVMLFITPEQKVPQDHPIRAIKRIVDRALLRLSPVFNRMYSKRGRPSIPPEHLLKASLLIALYSVRSERQFCERLEYDLLFKWFLDQNIDTPAFDASSFSKNRQRLLDNDVARQFFQAVLEEARQRELLSDEHFTVDGTLLDAWASLKSVQPKDEEGGPPHRGFKNPDVDYRGEKRSNETHASRTDPEAQLMRKGQGKETKLCFAGHVLMENRNGLVVEHRPYPSDGAGRTRVGPADARPSAAQEAALDPRGRQRLRRARVRRGAAPTRGNAARVAEPKRQTQRYRRPDDQLGWLQSESADTQAGGGDLRLGQDNRRRPQAALHRPRPQQALGAAHGSGLQPRTNDEDRTPAGCSGGLAKQPEESGCPQPPTTGAIKEELMLRLAKQLNSSAPC